MKKITALPHYRITALPHYRTTTLPHYRNVSKNLILTFKLLSIVFLVTTSQCLTAQSLITEYFNPTNVLTNEKLLVYQKFNNLSITENSKLVKFGNVKNHQIDGKLTIQMPFSGTQVAFQASRVEYENDDNYVWYGEMLYEDNVNTTPDYFLMTNTDGYLCGDISVGGVFIKILPVSKEHQIAVLTKEAENLKCGLDVSSNSSPLPCIWNNTNQCRINILVAYPPNVETAIPAFAIGPIAKTGIEQLNTSLSKSKVKHQARLVGVEKLTDAWVDEGVLAEKARLTNYLATSTSSFLSVKRHQTKADLVVVLTLGTNYINVFGSAANIPATSTQNSFAVVQISSAIGTEYVFSHEVGHLLGGGHDDYNEPARAHKFVVPFLDREYTTIMHRANGLHPLRFSNPDVNLLFTPTGTPTNNNACVIQNLGCDVSSIIPAGLCSHSLFGFFNPTGVGCKIDKLAVTVSLTDINGEVVLSNSCASYLCADKRLCFHLPSWKSGAYAINILDGSTKVATSKFIKQ